MFKKNFRLISMNIKSIYLYGNISNLKKLINYFTKEKIKCYFLENIKVKDKEYIIRRIIEYIKLNNIDAIYILDNTFLDLYIECKKIGIRVLNRRIFFQKYNDIKKNICSYLRIPIIRKTNYLNNYENLIIEALDKKFPLLVKKDNIVFQKINNCYELNLYKQFIKKLIKFFNLNNKIYLEEFKENSRKIIVCFFNDNDNIQIINYFEVLFVLLQHNIIIKSISKLNCKIKKELFSNVKKICKYYKLKFGYIEFIINKEFIFFNKITNLDDLIFSDRNFIKKIYKVDLFDILLNKTIIIKNFINKILILNEVNYNYQDFYPFYYDNKVEDFYKNKIVHIKEFTILKDDILYLLSQTKNIFFKEIVLKSINNVENNKLFVKNLYNEKEIYFIKILNNSNDNYFLKRNNTYDRVNSKLGNFILNNNSNETFIEIKDNDMQILFYNNLDISITGTEFIDLYILRNNQKKIIKLYTLIEIQAGDILCLNRKNDFNLNYLCVRNGFNIQKNQDLIRKNKIIFYNKIKISKNKNTNFLKKKYIPKIKNKIKLNIIEGCFIDSIDNNLIDIIYKNTWKIEKKNNDIILCTNKIFKEKVKNYKFCKKYIKYPRGTVIINKLGLIIVNSLNYNYFEGISIFNIIDIDIWQISYLLKNNYLNWNKVSLDYAKYKNNLFENFIQKKELIIHKVLYNENINRDKTLLSKFFDVNNMTNIEIRLMGDKHILVHYKKRNKKINNDNYIEYTFRQKTINSLIKKYEIINGYNFYILKHDDDIDKIVLLLYKLENEIKNINEVTINKIKLPIILNKQYFSDKIYLDSFLKINNLRDKNELKLILDNTKYLVIEKNSLENNITLLEINPNNKLFLIERDINQKLEDGLIGIDNFSVNINYNNKRGNNKLNIFCKTLPIFKNKEFLFDFCDIIEFELVETKIFNSVYNHFILGKYFVDKSTYLFNFDNFKVNFNKNLNEYIKNRDIKINYFNKKKKDFIGNQPKNLINLHEIRSKEEYNILGVYINYNDNIKFGDKICKVQNNKNEKYYIKSNMSGLITKILISKGKFIEKNEILIKILEY